ncbi:MAG: hypothetical protein ACRDGJ_06900 [Candidatus Limnocylindria bacterium]
METLTLERARAKFAFSLPYADRDPVCDCGHGRSLHAADAGHCRACIERRFDGVRTPSGRSCVGFHA